MRNSVLLTVYDREPEVLLSTLRSLHRSMVPDTEVIIVNDGSHMDYEWVKDYAKARLGKVVWVDLPEYEAFRIDGGFNNPAKAFNEALQHAEGSRLYIMSSDVVVTPNVIKKVETFDLDEMAWTPLVIDMDSGMQYCGPMRLFPAPWFLACSREKAVECGGWDENYLNGMCYEDNDFMGRIMLYTKRFIGDWSVAVYHQSHNQPAYSQDDPEVMAANKRNREYTKSKWSGIPFGGGDEATFDIIRKPYVTGDIVHECKYYGTLLPDTIQKTKSPFVKVPA